MFVRFVLALLPILWLAVALSVWKRPAYQVCPLALALTVLPEIFISPELVYKVTPTLEQSGDGGFDRRPGGSRHGPVAHLAGDRGGGVHL